MTIAPKVREARKEIEDRLRGEDGFIHITDLDRLGILEVAISQAAVAAEREKYALLVADKEREIETLRARVAALEAGLKPFALAADSLPTDPELQDDKVGDSDLTVRDFNLARTLLDGGTR